MELLDIFDEDMNKIGVEDRKVVHEKGLWHIHVGVWMMNQEGKILLQKRSFTKKLNPNKWTRTGGHVDSGETPLTGIQREVEEEIGVTIPKEKFDLINIDKAEVYFSEKQIYNRHFVYNYFAYVDYKIEEYSMQKEEVSDLKYISIEEMENAQNNKDKNYTFVNWNKEKFNQTILILKQKRDKIRQKYDTN